MLRRPRIAAWVGLACLLSATVSPHTLGTGPAAATKTPVADVVDLPWDGRDYPLRLRASFPAALMHWLDSVAGLSGVGYTGGKSIRTYRNQFRERFGPTQGQLRVHLGTWKHTRTEDVRKNPRDPFGLTRIFIESNSYAEARARAAGRLPRRDRASFLEALDYYAVAYRGLWKDGERARQFVQRSTPEERIRIDAFLQRLVTFLEAAPPKSGPRIVLVPVPSGPGTHAQAIGDDLLIEVRPGERLLDQIETIVHENVHYLFRHQSEAKQAAYRKVVTDAGRRGRHKWELLGEALPTALGQGTAGRVFHAGYWSKELRWYHRDDVDTEAKRIYRRVDAAFRGGTPFDAELFRTLLD